MPLRWLNRPRSSGWVAPAARSAPPDFPWLAANFANLEAWTGVAW